MSVLRSVTAVFARACACISLVLAVISSTRFQLMYSFRIYNMLEVEVYFLYTMQITHTKYSEHYSKGTINIEIYKTFES